MFCKFCRSDWALRAGRAGWIDSSVGFPVSRSSVKSGGSACQPHLLEIPTQSSASNPSLAFQASWLLPGTPARGFDCLPNWHQLISGLPFEPLPPPSATPAPLPVSVSLSWLLALFSSWSTHASNLKKRPSSSLFSTPCQPPAKSAQTQLVKTHFHLKGPNTPYFPCPDALLAVEGVEGPGSPPPPAHHLQSCRLCLESKMAAVVVRT